MRGFHLVAAHAWDMLLRMYMTGDCSNILCFIEEMAILLLQLCAALLRLGHLIAAWSWHTTLLNRLDAITFRLLRMHVLGGFLLQDIRHGLASRFVLVRSWNRRSVITVLLH